MKKIFKTLVIIYVVLFATSTVLACSCSTNTTGVVTGGACSISELTNLEKYKAEKGKWDFLAKPERNLRPVKPTLEIHKINNENCLFGMCLYRTILEEKAKEQ